MKSPGIVMVKEPFVGRIGKVEYDFVDGDLIAADNPAALEWPEKFAPPVLRYPVESRVEQATSAPGEKRKR